MPSRRMMLPVGRATRSRTHRLRTRPARDDVTESEDSGEQDGSGAAEDADAELPDMGSPDTAPDVEVDPDRPATPTVCTDANRGTCACNDAPGFTTWTWWVADQQRCATTYVPPAVSGPLPVVISNDCYSSNGLGVCQSGSEMVEAAGRFGFIGVCTTAADGNWTFGNDGVVNDDVPTPCAAADSKDVLYLDGVFGLIDALAESGEARADAVYAWGFSQNAMFTAWTAFCRPERIAGFWQGGSGLFVAGETNPLPQMEGACRRSDFLEHDRDCVDVAPCEDCQYFPVYPAASTPPLSGCVSAYTDDFLFETVPPMAREMAREGHAPTELHFPDIGRGHANPLLHWEWMMGCMQVVEACDDACAASVVACVDRRSGASAAAREADFLACAGEAEGAEVCRPGCAPTLEMLRVVERPCLVDGVCDSGETSATCPVDCGGDAGGEPEQLASCAELGRDDRCCGDGVCDGPETPVNCTADCA